MWILNLLIWSCKQPWEMGTVKKLSQFYRWGNQGTKEMWLGQDPWALISSVQLFIQSDSFWPHGLQHARPPCPSPTPGVYLNSCPSRWWCHPTILSSVDPFSSCLQSFLASGSFPMSQLFASGGQSIGISASALVLTMNIQDLFPLGLTGLIS